MKTSIQLNQQVTVCLGDTGVPLGKLIYVKQGQRENTAFAYATSWLNAKERFAISPDLPLIAEFQQHKAASKHDSSFHFALADTEPDAWGRRVIARAHAKRRKNDANLAALTAMDYLLAVDDESRIGALRLCDQDGNFLRQVEAGKRSTPPLIELPQMYAASRAVEAGNETALDLMYLQGKGTSLGGMRPKCTVRDENGRLAIGKFPSVGDTRSVTRGEVLALHLAQNAGIDAAHARIVNLDGTPVAVIQRFDRAINHGRIPYLSAASLLLATREEEHTYTEIADAIRANGAQPTQDVRQLWRRMLFNLLICNVDDHLQNHGFLHVANGQWKLAPAFDLNPFPDKENESKTWLSEQDGPITDVAMLIAQCSYFALRHEEALSILSEVTLATSAWRKVALNKEVGLTAKELDDFAPAFEHAQAQQALAILRDR